ncbi:hypothetical protein Pogu_1386 [Pyrobaculum oguniense TE7]|uniref:Uncharacterized protein n=1 Tax=Pyrobaculum oguniense (strain DSM 13380 / JCM 10595 / TE7) TaxID=698757 RepID=H6Q932_PYROT|nr:hypothetical protein Pogu_1386 [Pyrobaculum oguniense TE7]
MKLRRIFLGISVIKNINLEKNRYMGEEIQLEEPVSIKGGKKGIGGLLLGIAIGLVIGIAVGYYVNTATLQYAYNLLSSAQPPPPDAYIVGFKPGQMLLATPMGSPISVAAFDLKEPLEVLDYNTEYYLVKSGEYLYLYKTTGERVSRIYVEGLLKGYLHGGKAYVISQKGVAVYQLPDFVLEKEVNVNIHDAYMLKEEAPLLYVLTPNGLLVLNAQLAEVEKFSVSGMKLFVGAYYFFVWDGERLTSYYRNTGRTIASVTIGGGVKEMFACRGIFLVLTDGGIKAYKVPDLQFIKTVEVSGIRMRHDPSCSIVYVLGNDETHVVMVPSLSHHVVELSLDDVVVRSGASGVAVAAGGRQIALACGG